jgi:hypothetical protein
MRHSRSCLALAAIGFCAALPVRAQTNSGISAIGEQLNSAAAEGPAALLQKLEAILSANPALAASPESAAGLARAAATPMPDFIGATMPVYRSIAEKIIAAAPSAQQDAVSAAVEDELSRMAATDPQAAPITPTWKPGQLATGEPEPITHGYKVGSFTIYPDVKSGFFFDDNIYATRTGKQSDWVGALSPRIIAQSNWAKNQLVVEAQTDVTRYLDHVSENTTDWHASAEGRIDATQSTQFLLGALALREHEDRASPDAVAGLTPTPYTQLNSYGGIVHHAGPYTLRLGTAFEHLTFGNVEGTHGLIDNQDRNRERFEVGGLVRYDRYAAFRPYIEATGIFHSYLRQVDDFGFRRDSQGAVTGVGALWRISADLTGDAFLGAITRNYDDGRFHTKSSPTINAYLRWQPTVETATLLFVDRSLEETTLPGSPGYYYTIVGGRLEHALTENLTGILRAAGSRANFIQNSRIDNEGDFSAGLRYALTQNLTLGCDYRYTLRSSTDSTVNYGRNQFFVRLSAAF